MDGNAVEDAVDTTVEDEEGFGKDSLSYDLPMEGEKCADGRVEAASSEGGRTRLVVSLASYPKRFDYCRRTLDSILHQTAIEWADRVVVNVDDTISDADLSRYESLKAFSQKLEVKVRPAEWKSANKLLWTYRENPDAAIVCFDDDKNYPLTCMERLCEEWARHTDCIVAEEVNPYTIDSEGVKYIDDVDIKLRQRDFGKYLSNACLFPPGCLSDVVFDRDRFMYVTGAMHDELWFWIASVLKGTRTIGLDWTYACHVDGIWMEEAEGDLFRHNSDPEVKRRYYSRMNELFGKDMIEVMMSRPVEIDFGRSNKVCILNSLRAINDRYRIFPVEFVVDRGLRRSWPWILSQRLREYGWYKCNIR